MKCDRCGQEISAEADTCPKCGQTVVESKKPSSRQSKRNIGILASLVGLVVVAVAVLLIFKPWKSKIIEVTPVPSPQQTPIVKAPSLPPTSQPDILESKARSTPTEVNKQAPPPEVVAYLDHLSKVEKMRQDVTAKELNDLVAGAKDIIAKAFPFDEDVDESSATRELSAKAAQFSKEWQQISAYFLQVQPPPACSTLAGKYYDALREFITFMTAFQDATMQSDVSKLKDIRRDQVSVDQKFLEADEELTRVCKQFEIEKTFSIRADTGQTPLVGF